MSRRLLDPVERTSEVLFGLIMVLTFTTSLDAVESGREDTRAVLVGAIACNVAWGLVDAVMYLMASFMERARGLATLVALRGSANPAAAHALVADALPPVVAAVLVPSEIESIRQRLSVLRDLPARARLNGRDYAAALGVFLLVFVSTFPVVIPFIVVRDVATALRMSNGIATVMLFAVGWQLGRYAGRPGWRTGLGMVGMGIALVAITIALGG